LSDEYQTAADLLRLYVEQQDEEAFAEIVRMHTGKVYAACMRQLDGRTDLAEDATQAAFVALARSAKSIRHGKAVSGWLYGTAVLSARQILRGELRRRERERKVAEMAASSIEDTATLIERTEVLAHLDDALTALPRKQRDAVVMCYLDDRTQSDVAEELSCSKSTIKRRVASGLARLQRILSRRGVVLGVAALAAHMTSQAAHAAPEALILKVQAAVGIGGVTAAAAGASPHVAALAGKVLKMMFWARMKTVAAVVSGVLIAGAAGGTVIHQASAAAPPVAQAAPVELRAIALPPVEGEVGYAAVYHKKLDRVLVLKTGASIDGLKLSKAGPKQVVLTEAGKPHRLAVTKEMRVDALFLNAETVATWDRSSSAFKLMAQLAARSGKWPEKWLYSGLMVKGGDGLPKGVYRLEQLLRELAGWDSPFAVPALLRLKEADDTLAFPDSFRIELGKGLARHRLPGGMEILKSYFHRGNAAVHFRTLRVMDALGYADPREALPLLKSLLVQRYEYEHTAGALAQMRTAESIELLLGIFKEQACFNGFERSLGMVKDVAGDHIADIALFHLKKNGNLGVLKLLAGGGHLPDEHGQIKAMLTALIPKVKKNPQYQVELAHVLMLAGERKVATKLLMEIMPTAEQIKDEPVLDPRDIARLEIMEKRLAQAKATGDKQLVLELTKALGRAVRPSTGLAGPKVYAAYVLAKYLDDKDPVKAVALKFVQKTGLAPPTTDGYRSKVRSQAQEYLLRLKDPAGRKQVLAQIEKGMVGEGVDRHLQVLVALGDKAAAASILKGFGNLWRGNTAAGSAYATAYKALVLPDSVQKPPVKINRARLFKVENDLGNPPD